MPEMFISFVTRYLANFGRRLMPNWVKSETSQRFRQTSIAAPTTISPLSKRAFSSEGAILLVRLRITSEGPSDGDWS